ncbi:MAG: polysaccharide deacetylase family protein [Bryobacteraceae bacterium]|nr:polysaccharide deacetylase family protein [Bryobacteraceae bacterium]
MTDAHRGLGANVTRREVLAAVGALAPANMLAADQPSRVGITIDDVAWAGIPEPFRIQASEKMLSALRQHGNLRAALFVTGTNVDSAQGRAILQNWSDQEHMIANHTWSHASYHGPIAPTEFGSDILRCDRSIRSFPNFRPYFRFPALKEGATPQRRDWMRRFLHQHGYLNGAVTIDASDWYYDQRLRAHLTRDADFDVNRFREPYLAHIRQRASYYDKLARRVLVNRPVVHTLLIHFNLLNALFLSDLLKMFSSREWIMTDAEKAFGDPVFRRQPDTVPAGESLICALARETGRFERELRYPGEDDVYEKPILDRLGL